MICIASWQRIHTIISCIQFRSFGVLNTIRANGKVSATHVTSTHYPTHRLRRYLPFAVYDGCYPSCPSLSPHPSAAQWLTDCVTFLSGAHQTLTKLTAYRSSPRLRLSTLSISHVPPWRRRGLRESEPLYITPRALWCDVRRGDVLSVLDTGVMWGRCQTSLSDV